MRQQFSRSWRVVALGLVTALSFGTLEAQDTTDFAAQTPLRNAKEATSTQPEYDLAPIVPPADVSESDTAWLLKRLQATEARLAELEARQRMSAEIQDSMQAAFSEDDASFQVISQSAASSAAAEPKVEAPKPKKWYEKLTIRGYAQIRISEETFKEDGSAPAHFVSDRSVSDNQSFLIRRARVIISGDVHEKVHVYLQTDFANAVPGSPDATHFAQVRDWYADFYLDSEKEHRLRGGQSKVPYGWENLQSSSNRVPLERTDGINASAVRNERDLGVFYYWTPVWAQDLFKEIMDRELKHSGNYGVFGFGTYVGQGGSFQEQNDNLHLVSRLTIPVCFDNGQIIEAGVQGYIGEFVVLSSPIHPLGGGPAAGLRPTGTLETGDRDGWDDKRVAASFIWYPQPIGFQAEWNVGRAPALDATQTAIEDRALYGGYAMVLYKLDDCYGTWFPYVRYNYFQGGYKSERNSPYVTINEWEFGTEWQINSAAELTLAYLITDRTNTTAFNTAGVVPYQQFDGHFIRLQFQFNY